ncbi:MAG TPA: penicillin-binding protein 1A [Alphaproteobacteria bacterium]|jgi:penicillin-binding protein 1A
MGVIGTAALAYALWHYGRDLPDYRQLANYEPPIVTRVYAGNGQLLGEFAEERRIFVPIDIVPRLVINAFVAAEDKTFFEHSGIDIRGIIRAAITNLQNMGEKRPEGASTITQQVAKNFLLSNEVSIERKIKEILLAFRIEHTFSKAQILELYLNEIYLGNRSYGVAAAAQSYFNKSLDQLTLSEAAFLAGLPKAPSRYNPVRNYDVAIARRNYVIERMAEDGYISAEEAAAAMAEPLVTRQRESTQEVHADYFVEEVRRELLERYGEDKTLRGGMVVRTTVDPYLQELAYSALRKGLIAYDRRHGWRGPIESLGEPGVNWPSKLAALRDDPERLPIGIDSWQLAVVLQLDDAGATVGVEGGAKGRIPFSEMAWARPWREDQHVGPPPKKPSDVLNVGDVVAVEPVSVDENGNNLSPNSYGLRQVPDVQGAIVAMDPHTGRVLAMVGGYSFSRSQYNRATQAKRQPGSAFKPFVYLAALDNGFTPTSIVLDAPVVIKIGEFGKYKPQNYSKTFYGPVPLRIGLEKSRNLMTVRLAQAIGIDKIVEYGERFGISDHLLPELSTALGAGETTVLRLTTAYAMLVNGGKRIKPTLFDRIQDRHGKTILRHDTRPCIGCVNVTWENQVPPSLPDQRERIVDPLSAYQIVSMLEGAVQRGTGTIVRSVGKPIAGKTGTTNDSFDAWFVGFTPDLVAGVWVGFDQPRTLGQVEQGASAAAPIFRDFMKAALEDKPATPFRIPQGIRLVRINEETGLPAQPGDRNVIVEAFKPGTEPTANGIGAADSAAERRGLVRRPGPASGTGGLY